LFAEWICRATLRWWAAGEESRRCHDDLWSADNEGTSSGEGNYNFYYMLSNSFKWWCFLCIQGIGGKSPRSFVPNLATILYKMTWQYIDASRQWLHILLLEVGCKIIILWMQMVFFHCINITVYLHKESFPSSNVDNVSKNNFVKNILGYGTFWNFIFLCSNCLHTCVI
jgi:hypothetical protein